jgi:hypothetical protein
VNWIRRMPSPAIVVAVVALMVALGGTAYAVATINGSSIINRTIAGKKLERQAVGTAELKNKAVSTAKVGKVPSVRVSTTGSQSIDSSGGNVAITFDKERWDTNAMHSTTTNTSRLVAKVAGLYEINATIVWATNATGGRFLGLLRTHAGSSSFIAVASAPNNGVFEDDQSVSTTFALKKGDYVEAVVYQTSGAPLDIEHIPATTPDFGMTWLGPVPASFSGTISRPAPHRGVR